jgi:hypothetical protein
MALATNEIGGFNPQLVWKFGLAGRGRGKQRPYDARDYHVAAAPRSAQAVRRLTIAR